MLWMLGILPLCGPVQLTPFDSTDMLMCELLSRRQ